MQAFADVVAQRIPRLGEHGKRRAAKAFVHKVDSITKPSYINRLDGDGYGCETTQRAALETAFTREPLSGGLVFSIFDPRDLLLRRRPGYVPCLIAGSLLLHRGKLHLNAFFRSQSLIEFGVHDLLFLRRFQCDFLNSVGHYSKDRFPKTSVPRRMQPGPLNLHLARVIIQRRLARNRHTYLRRSALVSTWMGLLQEVMERETGSEHHGGPEIRRNNSPRAARSPTSADLEAI
jgi:hypothetical protein